MVGAWKLHCENQSLLLITLTGWCRLSSNSDGRVTMSLMFQVPSTLALIHILSTLLITIKYSRYASRWLNIIRKLTYFFLPDPCQWRTQALSCVIEFWSRAVLRRNFRRYWRWIFPTRHLSLVLWKHRAVMIHLRHLYQWKYINRDRANG